MRGLTCSLTGQRWKAAAGKEWCAEVQKGDVENSECGKMLYDIEGANQRVRKMYFSGKEKEGWEKKEWNIKAVDKKFSKIIYRKEKKIKKVP